MDDSLRAVGGEVRRREAGGRAKTADETRDGLGGRGRGSAKRSTGIQTKQAGKEADRTLTYVSLADLAFPFLLAGAFLPASKSSSSCVGKDR